MSNNTYGETHSNLEVFDNDPLDTGKQVVIGSGLIPGGHDDYKEASGRDWRSNEQAFGVVPLPESVVDGDVSGKKTGFWASLSKRKVRFIIIGSLVVLLIIIAVVLGVTLSKANRSGSTKKSSSVSSSSSSTSTTASSAPEATAISTPNNKIAAVSYSSASVNTTRVYYQDKSGQLMESTISSEDNTWKSHGLGFTARNESPIAAAVTKPGLEPIGISVFYMDTSNKLHDIIYNSSTSLWTSGTLFDQDFNAYTDTDLTALYNPCPDCTYNTIIGFQDPQGIINVGNQSDVNEPWILQKIRGEALGTSLSFQNNTDPPTPGIRANLWFQNSSTQDITYSAWASGSWPEGGNAIKSSLDSLPSLVPISVAASYDAASTGSQVWIHVVTLTDSGLRVDTWGGDAQLWLLNNQRPSVLTNSTSNQKIFGDFMITAMGELYAVTSNSSGTRIESWAVESDLATWNEMGVVDIGGVWG